MGLTSCRWITRSSERYRARDAVRNRRHAGCCVAVKAAADGYRLICEEPVKVHDEASPAGWSRGAQGPGQGG